MIAGNDQQFQPRRAQPVEPCGRCAELLDPRALGQVAADDDQVGPTLLQPGCGGVDYARIVRAEMNVGQMSDTGHDQVTIQRDMVSPEPNPPSRVVMA